MLLQAAKPGCLLTRRAASLPYASCQCMQTGASGVQVAMKVIVRAKDVDVSNAVHSIIQDA